MKNLIAILILVSLLYAGPAIASDDGYDLTNFKPGSESYGSSSFRLTPDMLPKHSYRRMVLMKTHGPRGKAIGFSTIKGKAFDYLNPETVNNRRYAPKASDPYLDSAYEAPSLDKSYDAAYQQNKSFGNQLKPLGQKHSAGINPFSNASKLFSIPNQSSVTSGTAKPFSNQRYSNKFNSIPTNSSGPAKVFDDESMF